MFLIAYDRIKSKPGNMTKGLNPETLDGLSSEWIDKTIEELKDESFQFKPARRIMIPKANGKMRPLTIASPRDKIVQQVMYKILMPIFEPIFSSHSHGFRPNLSCHTALKEVFSTFQVTSWVIEGDIKACFDSFDHKILMDLIQLRIKDQKMINLLWKALRTGYGESDETIEANLIGTPQGSIISPLLCNIYLTPFDNYVESLREDFDKGIKATRCKEFNKISTRFTRCRNAGRIEDKKYYKNLMRNKSTIDRKDPNFRRLTYVRYADDWIIGIRGSRLESINILNKCNKFLKEHLKLDLSLEKTKISQLSKDKIFFLGTQIYKSRVQIYTSNTKEVNINNEKKK